DRYPVHLSLLDAPRAAHRLKQGHKHPDLARVLVVGRAEAPAEESLLGLRTKIERGKGNEERAGDQHEIAGGEAGAGEMQTQAGVDGVTREPVWPRAHELVVAVDLELEVVVPSEGRDRPQRKGDARDDEDDADPAKRLRDVDLRTGTRRDDDVRHKEEVRDVAGESARSRHRLAPPGHAARPRELRDDPEGNDARDRDGRYERRTHTPILVVLRSAGAH